MSAKGEGSFEQPGLRVQSSAQRQSCPLAAWGQQPGTNQVLSQMFQQSDGRRKNFYSQHF